MPETVTTTTYFWTLTLMWPTPAGPATWGGRGTFATSGTVRRTDVLNQCLELAFTKEGASRNADIVFFAVEPDEVRR